MNEETIKDEVWQTVQAMNKTWTTGNAIEELHRFFHKNMVAVTATDRNRLIGRDACIESWKRFVDSVKVLHWQEVDPLVQIYGEGAFAIVTYYFDMSFDMGGQVITMGGRDMFALVKEEGQWWIVADQFSSYP